VSAADRYRQLAADATPGPWDWRGGYPQTITNPGAILVANTYIDPDTRAYDAELIAAAPGMALLLADCLDTLAKHGSAYQEGHGSYINWAEADALLARAAEHTGETT
jgi:hypothetical protein